MKNKVIKPHGFTLMESLVALTICSIGMLAAMNTFFVTVDNTNKLKKSTLARISAENTINEHLLSNKTFIGSSQISCEQGGLKMICILDVAETPHPYFLAIKATVTDEHNKVLIRQVAFKHINKNK